MNATLTLAHPGAHIGLKSLTEADATAPGRGRPPRIGARAPRISQSSSLQGGGQAPPSGRRKTVGRPPSAGMLQSGDRPVKNADNQNELLTAAAAGDRKAREELSRGLLPRVRNLVRYLVRGDSDVDDIAQEAMVAVLRGLHTFRGEGSLKSWVDRIVARATFAYLKRLRGREARQVEYRADLVPVQTTPHATDQLIARRTAARMLDGLPEEQRSALVLHHVMGMGVREVADALDVPFETVRSRLRLAKARLRKDLADQQLAEEQIR